MPRLISEIASGQQFQFSSKEGQVAAQQTRRFRVLLQQAGEVWNIQEACQVFIGDVHPINPDLFCTNYDAQYEGDSRMVVVVTFNYESTPSAASSGGGGGGGGSGKDPKQFKPEERPANWHWSSTTSEIPVTSWRPVLLKSGVTTPDVLQALNPAGDMYDGISRLAPIVTISVEQFETEFSNKAYYVGLVNESEFTIGDTFAPRTLMVKGINAKPVHESHQGEMRRGWKVTYEIAYRSNVVAVDYDDGRVEQEIGWDIAIPVSGFNVKTFNPNAPNAEDDIFGQPLRHSYGRVVIPFTLPDNVALGSKARAMVKVLDYENGGAAQSPSASPIPLNMNGRPRDASANPPVLVRRYCVHKQGDFNALGLRLE